MRSQTVLTKLERIAEQAVQNPTMQFTTLAHLIDEDFLLRGHYQYFGIRGNYKMMEVYFEYTETAWKQWLGTRHRNGHIAWDRFETHHRVLFPLPKPRIVHDI